MRPSTSIRPRSPVFTPAASRPSALGVGRAAGGDAEVVEVLRARRPSRARPSPCRRLHVLDPRAGHDLDVLLAGARVATTFAISASSSGQDLVEHLDQHDLGAEAAERGRDLGSRGAGADHRQLRRLLVQQPHAGRVEDAALEARARDRQRHRARSRARPSRSRRSLPSTATLALAGQRAVPSSTSILCFFIRPATPPVRVFTTLSRCFAGARDVELRPPRGDAELGAVAHLGQHVGGAQHRLRRDAGLVQAAAAERRLALDDRGLHARAGRRGSRPRSRRARSRSRPCRSCQPSLAA